MREAAWRSMEAELGWGPEVLVTKRRAFQATKDPVLFAPWEDLISLSLCLTMSLGPALAGHWTSACPSVQGAGGPDVSQAWWFWNQGALAAAPRFFRRCSLASSPATGRWWWWWGDPSRIPSDLSISLPFRSSSAGWPLGGAGWEDF